MKEIIKATKELSKVETYLMTQSNTMVSLKDLEDGEEIEVLAVCEYRDSKENGEVTELTSIMSNNNKVICFQSKTATNTLNELVNLFGNESFKVRKISGKSKAGREFVDFELVI